MKNLNSIFERFLLILPGFLPILPVFFSVVELVLFFAFTIKTEQFLFEKSRMIRII